MTTTRLSTLLALLAWLVLAQSDLALSFGWDGRSEVVLSNNRDMYFMQNRGFYNQTSVQLKIDCLEGTRSVKIGWLLRLTECINEFYLNTDDRWLKEAHYQIFLNPATTRAGSTVSTVYYKKQPLETFTCDPIFSSIIIFKEKEPSVIKVSAISEEPRKYNNNDFAKRSSRQVVAQTAPRKHDHTNLLDTIAHTWQDGAYSLTLFTEPATPNDTNYSIRVSLSFENKYGFLPASEWPFVPFFGVMCAIYSLFAIFWLTCMTCCWRDLLQIHYWIGGVILLGLLEKAAYLAEYDGINRTGSTDRTAMVTAYVVSCLSGSVARMFVFAMTLGFGIVKQQLSPDLPKVIGVGALYFSSAMAVGMLSILKGQEAHSDLWPLVIIDLFIYFWMAKNHFASGRAIRAGKNMSELSLYHSFNFTIILCAIASIIFTIWSMMQHWFPVCIKEWKLSWLDTGFWHIAFSFLLFLIMSGWRPSKKSQGSILTDTDKNGLETKVTDMPSKA